MTDIKTMLKNALILFIITLVAGVSLGFVYQVTKEPIAYQEQLALIKANQAVFPDAADFVAEGINEANAASVLSNADYSKIEKLSSKMKRLLNSKLDSKSLLLLLIVRFKT